MKHYTPAPELIFDRHEWQVDCVLQIVNELRSCNTISLVTKVKYDRRYRWRGQPSAASHYCILFYIGKWVAGKDPDAVMRQLQCQRNDIIVAVRCQLNFGNNINVAASETANSLQQIHRTDEYTVERFCVDRAKLSKVVGYQKLGANRGVVMPTALPFQEDVFLLSGVIVYLFFMFLLRGG